MQASIKINELKIVHIVVTWLTYRWLGRRFLDTIALPETNQLIVRR